MCDGFFVNRQCSGEVILRQSDAAEIVQRAHMVGTDRKRGTIMGFRRHRIGAVQDATKVEVGVRKRWIELEGGARSVVEQASAPVVGG